MGAFITFGVSAWSPERATRAEQTFVDTLAGEWSQVFALAGTSSAVAAVCLYSALLFGQVLVVIPSSPQLPCSP